MAKAMTIRTMQKMMITIIQGRGIGIVIDLFGSAEFEDESMGVNELRVICIASRGVRVVVVGGTCEEREAEVDEEDAEVEGEDERLEVEEMELDTVCEGRDADCVDRGRDNESLVELEKVGEGLSNVMVTRVVGEIRFAMLEALDGWMRKENRGRALTY